MNQARRGTPTEHLAGDIGDFAMSDDVPVVARERNRSAKDGHLVIPGRVVVENSPALCRDPRRSLSQLRRSHDSADVPGVRHQVAHVPATLRVVGQLAKPSQLVIEEVQPDVEIAEAKHDPRERHPRPPLAEPTAAPQQQYRQHEHVYENAEPRSDEPGFCQRVGQSEEQQERQHRRHQLTCMQVQPWANGDGNHDNACRRDQRPAAARVRRERRRQQREDTIPVGEVVPDLLSGVSVMKA